MNCIIIEDQLPAQRILKRYIEDIGTLNLVGTFSNALQALDTINSQKIDLLFLDIHLPKLSGIDFLKTLPNSPYVILTTAFSDYALESYEFNVVDYLLKPFSFERFVKAVSKVTTLTNAAPPAKSEEKHNLDLFIKSGYEHIRISLTDIFYIKSDADYTEIHLSDKKHLSSETLKNWEEKLGNQRFLRVHKSFLVNTDKIVKLVGNQIHLNDDTTIPIGRAYKEVLSQKYLQ